MKKKHVQQNELVQLRNVKVVLDHKKLLHVIEQPFGLEPPLVEVVAHDC